MYSQLNESVLKTNYLTSLRRNEVCIKHDFIELINDYWYRFEPPTSNDYLIIALINIGIILFGVPGNTLVIYAYYKSKSLRCPANIYIVNLATSDLINVLETFICAINSFYGGPYFGKIGCIIQGLLKGVSSRTTIFILTIIAIERLDAVKHPLTTANKHTRMRACKYIMFAWIISFSTPIYGYFYVEQKEQFAPDGYFISCGLNYLTDINHFCVRHYALVVYLIATIIIIGSYSLIIYGMRRKGTIRRLRVENKSCDVMKKVAKKVKVLSIVWFISWVPYVTITLLSLLGFREGFITPLVSTIPAVCCKIGSCINPWIYALTNEKFKTEVPFFKKNKRNDTKGFNRASYIIKTIDKVCDKKKNTASTSSDCVQLSNGIDAGVTQNV